MHYAGKLLHIVNLDFGGHVVFPSQAHAAHVFYSVHTVTGSYLSPMNHVVCLFGWFWVHLVLRSHSLRPL